MCAPETLPAPASDSPPESSSGAPLCAPSAALPGLASGAGLGELEPGTAPFSSWACTVIDNNAATAANAAILESFMIPLVTGPGALLTAQHLSDCLREVFEVISGQSRNVDTAVIRHVDMMLLAQGAHLRYID